MASSLDAYRLCELQVTGTKLGNGSFATVFELNFKGLKCAGKNINLSTDEKDEKDTIERFEKECQLLSRVRHPNIVQFLGVHFQENAKIPFLVMEFLPMTLTFCIDNFGILPNYISYSILHDIALGLNYLHSQTEPIVHRDLSSNNVLLTYNLTAKIADLGISKILNLTPLQKTRKTKNCGAPAFMPPEMNVAKPTYAISIDEFSYGIIMIHLLSTQCPEPQLPPTICTEDGELIPVTEAKRREMFLEMIGLDHPLMDLIKRCISNSPKKRAHASDIAQQLEELITDIPHGTRFTNRLDMLQQLEADDKMLQEGQLEEKQYAKKIEMLREELQKSDDKLKELQSADPCITEKLKLEVVALSEQNKQLQENRKRLAEKQRRQDELVAKTTKTLEQIHQCLYGETAQNLAPVREGKVKRKRATTAPETPCTGEPLYTIVQMRKGVDVLQDEQQTNDGNLDVGERTSTLKRVGKKLKEMVTKHRAHQPVTLYVAKESYNATGNDELSIKQGDLMHLISNNGNWCHARLLETGEEGKIPSQYVVEPKSLDTEKWYFGKLEHDRAKELLMWPENTTGSYLVCEDAQKPRTFTFFIRNKENVIPYPIQKTKGGKFFIIHKSFFSSIHDLVEHYCTNLYPCIVPTQHNEIQRKEVKMLKKLTSDGHFSEVWQGLLKAKLVAVKTTSNIKQDNPYHNCLHEARIMQNLVHGNIVNLLGVCNEEMPCYIIMEYMVYGNLYEYLNSADGKSLEEPDLIKMAAQVASGMLQLELSNCIHRALAAKNVYIGENLICKVGNFHYAQVENIGQNFSIQPAIKWTAPEALESPANFSIKSDVWSFGIVLFEIITHGQTPYPDMTDDEVKHKVVHDKYRLNKPEGCPNKLYNIMNQCWKKDPACHLTFEALQWQLDDFDTLKDDYLYTYKLLPQLEHCKVTVV